MRRLSAVSVLCIAVLLALASLPACASAQATRDSTVCTGCIPVTQPGQDSAIASVDTVWVYYPRLDTTGYRDSLVPVPIVTPPPPPSPPSGAGPDTVGFRTLTVADFNYKGDPGTGPVPLGKVWSGNLGVYNDPVAGMVARYTYTVGLAAGRSPGFVWSAGNTAAATKTSQTYFRSEYRYSANFQNPTANVSKTMLLGYGPNGNQVILWLQGKGAGAHLWGIAFQGLANFAPSAQVGRYTHNVADCCAFAVTGNVAMRRGQWDTVEVQMRSGPPGSRTSRARLWVNRRLVVDVTGFDIVKAGVSPNLYYVKLANVWGGGGAPVSQLMTLDMDHLYVSGAP